MSNPRDNLLDLFRLVDRWIEERKREDTPEVKIILHGDGQGWFCEIFINDRFRHAFILHDGNEFDTAMELFE